MIYEYDQEMIDGAESDDADEIKMNEKRLMKTFEALGIQHQSYMQVQGQIEDEKEMSLQFQILSENPSQSEPYILETIKIGKPIMKQEPQQAKPEEKKEGDIELSSDGLLIQDEQENGEFTSAKKPKKRKVPAEEAKTSSSVKSSPQKRQKV